MHIDSMDALVEMFLGAGFARTSGRPRCRSSQLLRERDGPRGRPVQSLPNIGLEPSRLLSCAIMSPWRAAQAAR
jgi:hypothetical protein